MGTASIDDVIDYVKDDEFRQLLADCKDENKALATETQQLLNKYKDDGKEPTPIAKGMSWVKTNMKLVMNESDQSIADLITDGCGNGIKCINRYLNSFKAADETSKNIAKRLIDTQERLLVNIRKFL